MKNALLKATCIFFLAISFVTPSHAQCVVHSSDGYDVHVTIIPRTIVVSSTDCPWGYNYNVAFDYQIYFSGPNQPSALYTLQTIIGCGGQANGYYTLPLSGGNGSAVSTTNPFIPYSGSAYNYVGYPDCNHATVATLNCNSISLIIQGPGINYQTINCNYTGGALPVELVEYQGKAVEKGVELTWATASETSNDYFTVYKSTDGYDWQVLQIVKGAGTTTAYTDYRIIDNAPANGINYYKLLQTDYDGRVSNKGLLAVEFVSENSTISMAYPNPAVSGKVNVRTVSISEAAVFVTVTDELGRKVSTDEVDNLERSGSQYIANQVVQLPETNRVYFVEVQQNGEIIGRHKIVSL